MVYTFAIVAASIAAGLVLVGQWQRRWRPYDPAWLVSLAEAQYPEEPTLAQALRQCVRASIESPYYVRFVPARRANQAGAPWQFERNVTLESPEHGDIILDLLKQGRVGGMEFLSKLLASGA